MTSAHSPLANLPPDDHLSLPQDYCSFHRVEDENKQPRPAAGSATIGAVNEPIQRLKGYPHTLLSQNLPPDNQRAKPTTLHKILADFTVHRGRNQAPPRPGAGSARSSAAQVMNHKLTPQRMSTDLPLAKLTNRCIRECLKP